MSGSGCEFGSGSGPEPRRTFASLFLDIINGQKVFSYGGTDICTQSRFMTRLVDIYTNADIYAALSDCCQYPRGLTEEFVEKDKWKPFGISRHLKIFVHPFVGPWCNERDCQEVDIEFNEGTGKWSGNLTALDRDILVEIELVMVGSAWVPQITFNGCVDPPFVTDMAVQCKFPFRARPTTNPQGLQECCECAIDTDNIVVEVFGYCRRRHLARHVDYVRLQSEQVLKVFAKATDCTRVPRCCRGQFGCCPGDWPNLPATVYAEITETSDPETCGLTGRVIPLHHVPCDSTFGLRDFWRSDPVVLCVFGATDETWEYKLQCGNPLDCGVGPGASQWVLCTRYLGPGPADPDYDTCYCPLPGTATCEPLNLDYIGVTFSRSVGGVQGDVKVTA